VPVTACTSCGYHLTMPADYEGTRIVCPECYQEFVVAFLPPPPEVIEAEVRAPVRENMNQLLAYAGDNERATNAGDFAGRLDSLDHFVLCLQRLKTLHATAPAAFTAETLEEVVKVKQEVQGRSRDLAASSAAECEACGAAYDRWKVGRCFNCGAPACPACSACGCGPGLPATDGLSSPVPGLVEPGVDDELEDAPVWYDDDQDEYVYDRDGDLVTESGTPYHDSEDGEPPILHEEEDDEDVYWEEDLDDEEPEEDEEEDLESQYEDYLQDRRLEQLRDRHLDKLLERHIDGYLDGLLFRPPEPPTP
jgi:DNA-directed RNA polymerase subunit M/transcription elongation factor TFIIS